MIVVKTGVIATDSMASPIIRESVNLVDNCAHITNNISSYPINKNSVNKEI